MEEKIQNFKILTDKIKSTCLYVHENSKYVKINKDNLSLFVKENISLFENIPTWSSCHFDPNTYPLESVLGFIFFIDSLNFCFWPIEEEKVEYEYGNLVNNSITALSKNKDYFSPEHLINITPDQLKTDIFENHNFPLIEERARSLNELGLFVKDRYDSSYFDFINKNNKDCVTIAKCISEGVTTYRDETIFKGKQIFIYKRAQILAADLYSCMIELEQPITLKNAKDLTMFADYRVPQILSELQIFEYQNELSKKIDEKIQISPNSIEEVIFIFNNKR
jgi:hypothetical protein